MSMRRKPSQGVAGARDVPRNDVRLDGVPRLGANRFPRLTRPRPPHPTLPDSQACATRTRRTRTAPPDFTSTREHVHQPARRGRSRGARPRGARVARPVRARRPTRHRRPDPRPLLRQRRGHRRARRRGRQTRPHRRVRPVHGRRIRATHREEVREPPGTPNPARSPSDAHSREPPSTLRRPLAEPRRGPSRTSHAASSPIEAGARSSVRSPCTCALEITSRRCA